jgi:heparinase II/III-like protein
MGVSPSAASARSAARAVRRRAGRAVRRLRSAGFAIFPRETDLLRFHGGRHGTVEEAIAAAGDALGPFLPPGLTRATLDRFYATRPGSRERLLKAADEALDHRFDLLGSGPVDLGPALPWHADFKSGHVWDRTAWYEDLRARVETEFGRGRDVKVPWELSRFQHAPLLAQAFVLTGDARCTRAIAEEVGDWIAANPIGRGVNWTCTMDVAIRALNWTWALALAPGALLADRAFASQWLRALVAHGRFIAANLEKGAGPASNHYVADLMGLLVLGTLFRGAPEADGWHALAVAEIERENALQTGPDGVDYEASIAYHRLKTEMAIVALALARRGGAAVGGLADRGRLMARYAAHYIKPNGLAPQVGDNDDGRLLVLGDHHADRRDHRSVLASAACLFDDPGLYILAGDRVEEAAWLCGPDAVAALAARATGHTAVPTSAAFPDAGVAVLRQDDLYVLVDAGGVGLGGQGGHAHNDTLSVEVQGAGEDLFIDPGTGSYTVDLALRDRFRSTAAHNTVRIDRQEINPLPGSPFSLPGVDRPAIVRSVFRRTFDLVAAEHQGYMRLADPVRHHRVVLLNRRGRRVLIEDRLEGSAVHEIEWFFHLAPGAAVVLEESALVLEGRVNAARFTLRGVSIPDGARWHLAPDLVSPGYGRVEPATTLVVAWTGRLPIAARFAIDVAPRAAKEGP